MRYRFVISTLFFVLVNVYSAAAQVTTNVSLPDRKTIRLQINSTKPLPQEFVQGSTHVASYKLYEIETPDVDKPCANVRCIGVWDSFIDPNNAPSCSSAGCEEVTLNLTKDLPAQGSFVLVVNDLEAAGKPGKVGFKVDRVAEIVGPWKANKKRSEFRVKSNVPLNPPATVTVTRPVIRLTPDSLNAVEKQEPLKASLLTALNPGPTAAPIYSFRLEKKLLEGNEYDLTIPTGLVDPSNQTVVAKGKLKIPGPAAPPNDPKISLTANSLSAVKQKSVLDFGFTYKSLEFIKAFTARKTDVYFEPEINADLGLRSTKSNNSVTFYLPLTAILDVEDTYQCKTDPHGKDPNKCDAFKASNIPRFASWSRTPWYTLGKTKLYVGPKLEFDRTFQRRNVLGSAKLDFLFHRWQGSVSQKREKIIGNIGEEKGAIFEGINTGLKITPYISFDFGGHANNETVEKELSSGQTVSLLVPRHKILRGYAGFTGTIEWRVGILPMTITLDESMVYIGSTETIGYTTDTGVESRALRGFHPHFKTQWDIAFDPAKHYSFNVTFENGRLAPNFEYLNKLSSGIKIQY